MDTLADVPQSSLSGVARVLVHAGKLQAKAAEELVKGAKEKKISFVSSVIAAGAVAPADLAHTLSSALALPLLDLAAVDVQKLPKGVIDGTVVPWEVTLPLRVAELVNTHTTFSGNRSLYVSFFVFAMNKRKYESLPPDLKKVIDANSGPATSRWVGQVMDAGDAPGLEAAKKRGNAIVVLDAKETARWKAAAQEVTQAWIAEMKSKGIDGQALVDDARALIAKYAGPE